MTRILACHKSAVLRLIGMTALIFAVGCSPSARFHADELTDVGSQGLTGTVTITLATPRSVLPLAPALVASQSVTFGAQNNVTGTVVAMGTSGFGLNSGSASVVNGDVWSQAFASLGSSSRITGTLHASQSQLGAGATVGSLDSHPQFAPNSTLSWAVTLPNGPGPNVTVHAGQQTSLAPGNYGTITLDNGAKLALRAGTYFATNLAFATGSKISLDDATGPIIVYTTGSLTLNGTFAPFGKGLPDLFIGDFGTSPITLGGSGVPFVGDIVAPSTSITFSATTRAYAGYFAAKSIILAPGANVVYRQPVAIATAAGGVAGAGGVGGFGPPPTVASRPPRILPLPPKTQGCYRGTANGWASVPCSPSTSFKPEAVTQNAIVTPNGASATIPFQFAQLEQTFTAYGSEADNLNGVAGANNSFSIQGNTVPFLGNNTPAGSVVADTDWVQFAIGGNTTGNSVFIQTWDVSQFNRVGNVCPGGNTICDISCGCTTFGLNVGIPSRSSGFTQFDFSTVAGSVYNDVNNNPVLGMVAQLSWFDTNNSPSNFRGLYSIVAPDQYGLAGRWTDFSGAVLGAGSGSSANFTNSSILHRTLAGSCINGTSPVSGIPWPGTCTGSSQLLPATTISSVSPTGETNNLCQVGSPTSLVAANSNLVFFQDLWSTSCTPTPTCISNANRIFIRSTAEDTGARPINVGVQPFWESPDLFVVPQGTVVDVNGVSSETLITPGNMFDVYVRVNNDFGCSAVNAAQALVYLANPSTLSAQWVSITNNQYLGGPGNAGVSVPAGGRALIGPLTFLAPTDVGDGHKCLLAAIRAQNEPGPANTTDPLSSFQVGQRNVQFSNCNLPLTNATTSNGNVTITISASGATPSVSGANNLSVTFDDPTQAFFNAWQPGAGTAYALSQAGGKTTVRLGQVSVTLPSVVIVAGQSVTATAAVALGQGEPTTTLQVQASFTDSTGKIVANGLSCVGSASEVVK
jgi:hypothetical protein